ncbi:MAG: hypothetical protein R3283_11015 [Balneolaceae bacterium]|nr:hypothetical protein [Balneolaceae bacterium]
MQSKPIPFHFDVNHGFAEARGLLHIGQNELRFEFEVKDAIAGIIKSGVKEVVIPFDQIESLNYKKRLWGASVVITANSMKTFEEIPEAEQGRCKLKISRKDREQVEKIISSARVALSEHKLDQIGD